MNFIVLLSGFAWLSTATLNTWWEALTFWQQGFWAIALFFSMLFVLQYIVTLVGFGMSLDGDADMNGSSDFDNAVDPGFTWLSLRSIIAFFTFFGWTGVVLLGKGYGLWIAFISSFLSGMLAMALVAYMIYFFARQTQSGNYILRDALFTIAEVYLTVPMNKTGTGKVHVRIGNATREVDAVTEGRALATGTQVRIVDLIDNHLFLVEAVSPSRDN